jgi:hypothetical protein
MSARTLSIDWLAYTIKGAAFLPLANTEELIAALPDFLKSDEIVLEKGMFGYAAAARGSSGARALFGNDSRMGLHVIWSGSALVGQDACVLIKEARLRGAHFTRVDVAFDMREGCVADFVHAYKQGRFTGRRRDYSEIKSSGDGHTFYVGSRSSDQMMRIYNKAAQMEVSGIWIRAELETKGDLADGVCRFITNTANQTAAMLGVINAFVAFPSIPAWETGDLEYSISGSDKGSRKTREWALGAVRTQAELCLLDKTFMEDLLATFIAEGVDFASFFAKVG